MYVSLSILTAFVFFYSLVSGRVEKTPVSAPIIFISFGLLMGPLGVGLLDIEVSAAEFKLLVDLALAMLLFSDAANVKKPALRSGLHIPVRMLLIGLPGVIALGALLAWWMFDVLSIWEAALLGTMLAATDAALGKAVITSKDTPERVSMALNIESGLNDGLCVPILLLFIALATTHVNEADITMLTAQLLVTEIGVGVVVGLVLTAIGAWFFYHALKLGWINNIWGMLPVTMLSVTCFAVAQSLHGSGYIAAFVGGLLFGFIARRRTHKLVLDTESIGETFSMLAWVLFGSVVIATVIDSFSWQVLGYSLLSLTFVRILPILFSLMGSGETLPSKLFMGWFGPRGLASIVFVVIVLHEGLPNGDLLAAVVACTVILSAVAHGLSAHPLISLLAKKGKS